MAAQPSPYTQPPKQGMSTGAIIAIVVGGVLLLVIAVIGVFAVLAIHGTRKYIAAAKTSEARFNVGLMAKDAQAAYEMERMAPGSTTPERKLCASAAHSVPTSVAMVRGMKYMSAPSEWTGDGPDAGWECLKFSIDSPQYYMYSYDSTGGGKPGDTFTAKANGDLNGDGVVSTFSLEGRVAPSGDVEVAPTLTELDPEE